MADYPSYFWGGSGEVLHIIKDWDGAALCGRRQNCWVIATCRADFLDKRACLACSEEPSGLSTWKGASGRWRSKSLQEAMLELWGRGC